MSCDRDIPGIIAAVRDDIDHQLEDCAFGVAHYGHRAWDIKYDEGSKIYSWMIYFGLYNNEMKMNLIDLLDKWKGEHENFNYYMVKVYNVYEIHFQVKHMAGIK